MKNATGNQEAQNGRTGAASPETEQMNATTETTTDNFTIVEQSSAACAAYNEQNAAMIAAGIVFPQRPSQRVLDREAAAEKAREEEARREAAKAAVLAEFKAVNPTGVRLALEAIYSGGGTRWSSGYHSGWKLVIGDGYGADANKKWMAVGEGTKLCVTAKQLAKAQEKIAEVAAVAAAAAARRNAKLNVQQRTEAFIKDNPHFCSAAGHTSYNSGETFYYGSGYNRHASYQTAFLVTETGAVRIGGEVFTVAQWTEIFKLRAEQAAAMKALKASYAAAAN